MIIKKGAVISNGIAIGKALVICRDKISVKGYRTQDTDTEIEKLYTAVSHTSKLLDQMQLLSKRYKELYDVYKLLLTDESFIGKAVSMIKEEKVNAEYALKKITDNLMNKLSISDNEYFQARMHDIKDIYMYLVRYMSNIVVENIEEADENSILIFNDFTVSDIDAMIKKKVKGFVSSSGNKMSHKSIIVRESGIVAVSNIKHTDTVIKTGDTVIVDGFLGYVSINPDETTLQKYKKKKDDYDNFLYSVKYEHDTTCKTKDGSIVSLYANINSNDELTYINVHGLNGVGLYRTEFLYINNGLLSEEEQYNIYKTALHVLHNKPLVIRTFDLGGDKISRFMPNSIEENPALGLRAVRYSMKYRDFFAAQIRAVLRAGTSGDIRLLLPMISSVDELLEVKSIIENEKKRLQEMNIPYRDNIPVGIMIEVPSTAAAIDRFIKYADFFSVGTNDLIQYMICVDRNNEDVSSLYSPVHPAILCTLKNIYDKVSESGKTISICGELAGDGRYIAVLIGLGYRSFSMNPRSSYMIRKMLSTFSADDCKSFVNILLSCDTIDEIEALITDFNGKQILSD